MEEGADDRETSTTWETSTPKSTRRQRWWEQPDPGLGPLEVFVEAEWNEIIEKGQQASPQERREIFGQAQEKINQHFQKETRAFAKNDFRARSFIKHLRRMDYVVRYFFDIIEQTETDMEEYHKIKSKIKLPFYFQLMKVKLESNTK